MNDSLFQYLCVACLATRPADAVLACLMKDDRAALHIHRDESAMTEELEYIWSVPSAWWDVLASVLGTTASGIQLRSDVLYAAGISGAYMSKKFFGPLKQLPWCLATGANIEVAIY